MYAAACLGWVDMKFSQHACYAWRHVLLFVRLLKRTVEAVLSILLLKYDGQPAMWSLEKDASLDLCSVRLAVPQNFEPLHDARRPRAGI